MALYASDGVKRRGTNPSELIAAAHAGSYSLSLANELGEAGFSPRQIDTTAADVALREIIEDRMTFEMPDLIPLLRPTGRNRKPLQHWAKDAVVTTSNEREKGKHEKHDIQSKTDERE